MGEKDPSSDSESLDEKNEEAKVQLQRDDKVAEVLDAQLDTGDELIRYRKHWWQLWCVEYECHALNLQKDVQYLFTINA